MNSKLWKRNAVVVTVLLFICVGIYLNWSYNREETPELAETINPDALTEGQDAYAEALTEAQMLDAEQAMETDEEELSDSATEYFASVRLTRQETRDSALELLQEAAAYTDDPNDETLSSASVELEDMVTTALSEAQIEGLVLAKGYADCVAFMNSDSISLAVAAPESGLASEDVARLSDIVTAETGYELSKIKIIEVK